MSEFIRIVLAMPTVIFTGMLAVALSFWLVSLAFGGDSGADLDLDGGLDFDADLDPEIELDGSGGFLVALDLHLMPMSLVFTVVALVGWFTSFVLVYLFDPGAIASVLVGLASFAVGVFAAGRIGRLAEPLFAVTPAVKQQQLVGRHCVIKTQRVDSDFGQAEVIDSEKSSHIIQVRSFEKNSFSAGSSALIVDLEDGLFTIAEGISEL